jgi:hypothetical protein
VERPVVSQRNRARDLGISRSTIQRILREEGFHGYKLRSVQELTALDRQRRVDFAQQNLAIQLAEPDLFHRILFSDEKHFYLNSPANLHNIRYYSTSHPHHEWHHEHQLHPQKVTVWAGLSWELGLIGPFFFEGNVSSQSYLNMLQNQIVPALDFAADMKGVDRDRVIFQQDGAAPHYSIVVRAFLDATFPQRWIGRGSPTMGWPARSPDLSPLDFFLWGYLDSLVHQIPSPNLNQFRHRISHVSQQIPLQTIQRSIIEYEHRLLRCIEFNGQNVEL